MNRVVANERAFLDGAFFAFGTVTRCDRVSRPRPSTRA